MKGTFIIYSGTCGIPINTLISKNPAVIVIFDKGEEFRFTNDYKDGHVLKMLLAGTGFAKLVVRKGSFSNLVGLTVLRKTRNLFINAKPGYRTLRGHL